MIRPAFVTGTFALLILACATDEPVQGYTAPPTEAEYLNSCKVDVCRKSEATCKGEFACFHDLIAPYKLRDVMECERLSNVCSDCPNDVGKLEKYRTDKVSGDLIFACKNVPTKCKGFNCPESFRLYNDDVLKNLMTCFSQGCSDENPFQVAECFNKIVYAKAPKCSTRCCDKGLFYACPSDDAAKLCFGGDTSACVAESSLDNLCAP